MNYRFSFYIHDLILAVNNEDAGLALAIALD